MTETGQGYAWLDIQRRSACGGCRASDGCGTAALAKIWAGKRLRVRALADLPLRPGDEVIVGMADGALLRGASLAYLLPLALLFAGAILGQTAFAFAGEESVLRGFVWHGIEYGAIAAWLVSGAALALLISAFIFLRDMNWRALVRKNLKARKKS